jgi:hypothetical protein
LTEVPPRQPGLSGSSLLPATQAAHSHAREQDEVAPADLTVDHIADILDLDLA